MKNFAFILLISMFFTSCSWVNDKKIETASEEAIQTEITQSWSLEIEENENSQETSSAEIMIENDSEDNSNTWSVEFEAETTAEISSQISSELQSETESEEALSELFDEIEELFELAEQK